MSEAMLMPMPERTELLAEGARVLLRPLSVEDVGEHYVGWLNDPETMQYLEYPCGSATLSDVKEYVARHESSASSLLLGIFQKSDGFHIGNIKLEPISWGNSKAVMGVLIGESSVRGKGIGKESVSLALGLCFEGMGLNRVELGVTQDNLPAIRCYESLGFLREGVLRQATRRGERYVDNYYYGILASDFEPEA